MRGKTADHGFTVVELLIAFSIASLFMTVITGVVYFSQRTISSSSDRADRLAELIGSRQFLLETLAQVSISKSRQGDQQIRGNSRAFTVVSIGPRVLALPSPERLTFAAGTNDVGMTVSWPSARSQSEGTGTRQLIDPTQKVNFEYFYSDRGWVNEWNSGEELPTLVQVRVRRLERDAADSSNLIIPVHILKSSECAAAPNPARC